MEKRKGRLFFLVMRFGVNCELLVSTVFGDVVLGNFVPNSVIFHLL